MRKMSKEIGIPERDPSSNASSSDEGNAPSMLASDGRPIAGPVLVLKERDNSSIKEAVSNHRKIDVQGGIEIPSWSTVSL